MTRPELEVHPDDLAAVSSHLNAASAALVGADLQVTLDAGSSTGRVAAEIAGAAAGITALAQHLAELAANTDAVTVDLTSTDSDVGLTLGLGAAETGP